MPFVSGHNPFRDTVAVFVERVMADAGLSRLPLEERAVTAAALAEEAQARVGLELLEAVDAWSLEEFRALADEGAADEGAADDEIAAFFRVRLPDADARADRALDGLRAECLRAVKQSGMASLI